MSATGWCRQKSRGFTFLEILIVMVILGLFWTTAGLHIGGGLQGDGLGLACRLLTGEIRGLRARAASMHREHFLKISLDKDLYWWSETGGGIEDSGYEWLNHEDETIPESAKKLPGRVAFEDVAITGKGKKQEGIAEIRFRANGSVERSLIHLKNQDGESFILEIHPLTGRVEVHDPSTDQKQV